MQYKLDSCTSFGVKYSINTYEGRKLLLVDGLKKET
jgi:hypothetical protein